MRLLFVVHNHRSDNTTPFLIGEAARNVVAFEPLPPPLPPISYPELPNAKENRMVPQSAPSEDLLQPAAVALSDPQTRSIQEPTIVGPITPVGSPPPTPRGSRIGHASSFQDIAFRSRLRTATGGTSNSTEWREELFGPDDMVRYVLPIF